jgi:hypothetical protein
VYPTGFPESSSSSPVRKIEVAQKFLSVTKIKPVQRGLIDHVVANERQNKRQ